METQFGHERFWTTFVEDHKDGFAGFRLHRERFGKTTVAAEVLVWDATGGFAVQTFNGDVPVEIIEALIAEARQQVRVQ
ncbi:MAG: hypothetical protein H7062_00160 [Candidatus Saccharimonas sp.]|nr:hypothetical protein [Planctomycetaceae bacterium]